MNGSKTTQQAVNDIMNTNERKISTRLVLPYRSKSTYPRWKARVAPYHRQRGKEK
jgi:hypothetical protein